MLFLISAFLGYDISFIRVGLMYRLQCRSTRTPTTMRMRNEGSCVCSRFRCFSNQVLLPRLITIYQILHDNIHAKSGQESTLKLQYIRTEREAVMGWEAYLVPHIFIRGSVILHVQITQPFEIYLALSPLIPKSAAINAANAIARWVGKEEKRLFLRDAPVF